MSICHYVHKWGGGPFVQGPTSPLCRDQTRSNEARAVAKWVIGILLECFLATACKRSLGQGNVFICVCHSIHRWGRLPNMHHRSHDKGKGDLIPGEGVCLRGKGVCPRERVGQTPSTEPEKRAVHILLECFLVSLMFLLSFSLSLDVSGPLMTANVVNFTTI